MVMLSKTCVELVRRFAYLAMAAVLCIAGSALWRWGRMTTAWNSGTYPSVAMNPLAALSFIGIILSLALLLSPDASAPRYKRGQQLAGFILALNGLRLIQYAFNTAHPIDHVLFPSVIGLNHMPPITAGLFGLIGFTLIILDKETPRHHRPAQYLALGASLVALVTVIGHVYRVASLSTGYYHYDPMVLSSAIAFLLLCGGILGARPQDGLMGVINSQNSGGVIARTMLPVAVIIPILLGYLRLVGERAGLYGMGFSAATFALSAVMISSGLILWVAVVVHRLDSERLKAEEDTRENRTFLESIVENIPDMIFVKEANTLRFIRMNKAGEALLGHPREELLGKNDYDFFPREQADFFVGKDREVLNKKQLLDISEEPIQTPRGERILHTKKIPLYNQAKEPIYLLGISEDITQRKKAEEELLQGRKLQAVGQLAAGIAHEINNPLSVILGFAQSMLHRMQASDPSEFPLKSIEREALRCKNLVQGLLTFSRDRRPGRAYEDPLTMLNGALSLIQAQTKIKRVEIRQDISGTLGKVYMDANQMQQVLINLCSNAMDAMSTGGVVTVSMKVNGDIFELKVSDTGTGIPPAIRDKIFEPFFTTKEPGKGTGIGLSLVYDIVKKHHGHIDVQSELGQGTTFTIRLPVVPPQENPQTAAAA